MIGNFKKKMKTKTGKVFKRFNKSLNPKGQIQINNSYNKIQP